MKKPYYITTAIAYTSGKPHIGNTYEIVLADSIARFKRMQGYDVRFQTGTDEHGQKIELKAAEAGKTPKQFVDEVAGEIKKMFMRSTGSKIGYLLCKKGMDDFREMFNQDKVGGAPFLGIAKPVIKAHGSSNEIAVMNAVRRAIAYTKSGMIDAVKENIQYMTVE